MAKLWCVRAEFGLYTQAFINGGYVAIGWLNQTNLSNITSKEELYPLYKQAYPEDKSNLVIGQQVGQIARFLLEMQVGDFVITPAANTDLLFYGELAPEPSFIYAAGDDGCPYRNRRRVVWNPKQIHRSRLSVPFQNTIRAARAVFSISHQDEFFKMIGKTDLVSPVTRLAYDPYRVVIDRILELDAREFEILVSHLLTAIGFDGSEVTGKSGDGGVDAIGELNVANLAKVKLFVQAKRYKIDSKISASTVRQLRQAIPRDGQGAFITTSDFVKGAEEIAAEVGFPRIGLVNGKQLVDLLIEHWNDIPSEFQERLGLKQGLVIG